MKRLLKTFVAALLIAVLAAALTLAFAACNDKNDTKRLDGATLRFVAPEGTPALAMLRLVTDNPTIGGASMQYEVVKPNVINAEMGKSDIVIMPINAGANLIMQGREFKLVSVAVEGSLYLLGNKEGGASITVNDLKGKRVACIGQNAVPGLVFRYVLGKNNMTIISEGTPSAENNEVYVEYAADGNAAGQRFNGGQVDYIVVGEPAATTMLSKNPRLNAEMDIQRLYSLSTAQLDDDNYPQAGLFVRASLASNATFMNALFEALDASEDWVEAHPAEVDAFAKAHLYEAASFPAASIPRCAIDCERLDEEEKNEIIAFLQVIAPKDANDNAIDWNGLRGKLF